MFVQVMRGRVADAEALRASLDRWVGELAPGATGWLGSTTGVDADGVAILVARFASVEAAQRNSGRPEQGQWWMATEKLFAGDVVFHDSSEVSEFGGGGSDSAGFVQVIQGRYVDPGKAVEQLGRMEKPLQELRPDVLGGLLCLHEDRHFTQVVYFASEAQARAGEQLQPPPDVQALLDEEQANMTDVVFYSFPDPWLVSPR